MSLLAAFSGALPFDVAPSTQTDWLSLSNPTSIVRIVGLLIPILTAVVSKRIASQGLKAVLTAVLSAITAAAAVLISSDGGFAWQTFINAFINAFVPAIAIYYGFWKPTGLAGSVAAATQNFGLGGNKLVLETANKGQESPHSAAGAPHVGEGGAVGLALLLVVLGAIGLLLGFLLPNHAFLIGGAVVLVVGVIVGFAGGNRTVL